jgi:hypothetical protein
MPTRNGSCIEATESAAERTVSPMVLVLMGVLGSGKSTVALELHRVLGWPFQEGDDLRPPSQLPAHLPCCGRLKVCETKPDRCPPP